MPQKLISIVTPCYNEEGNVEELYERVKLAIVPTLEALRYEHIFIDNASTDRTVEILRAICARDKNVKVIVNRRNFGPHKSPYHAFLLAKGDAVVCMAADLQDPPELIPQFIAHWRAGFKVSVAVKRGTKDGLVMKLLRRTYYKLVSSIAEVELIQHTTGYGLYDKEFMDLLREIDDPQPYVRGLISEWGFSTATVPFDQPLRKAGVSKHTLYSLYDFAMLGITSHSLLPLRAAAIGGFFMSAVSVFVGLVYFVYKLLYWNSFVLGAAPMVIGLFLSFSVQLFFLGLLGEYIALIRMHTVRRPLVVERERINFDVSDAIPHAEGSTPNVLPAMRPPVIS